MFMISGNFQPYRDPAKSKGGKSIPLPPEIIMMMMIIIITIIML